MPGPTTQLFGVDLRPKSELGLFGSMGAPQRSKELLLKDIARMEQGKLGLSEAEKRQAAGAATEQAGALIQAQQQQAARQAMGSPLSAVSGRAAQQQLGMAGQLAEAGAQASAAAEQLSQQKAMAEKGDILGRLERQQDRARENAQFWIGTLLGEGGILESLGQGAGAASAATEAGAGEAAIAGLAAACWVAEELYGLGDPRVDAARFYVATHDGFFLRAYRRWGRAWAAWLHRHPWTKPLVRPVWNRMAARGMEA